MLGECGLMTGRRKSSYIFAVEVAALDRLTLFYCNRPTLMARTPVQSEERGAPKHSHLHSCQGGRLPVTGFSCSNANTV